jgi:asparagine synthetase B (glutamine-hydrolysing)
MCGIACILELRGDPAALRERAVAMARLLRHRGPSIACSTPTAIAWDTSFAANADPSGRPVLGIHRDARGGA